jgi:mannose-6-phosphate isomerase-like protein (cupin superfamily)
VETQHRLENPGQDTLHIIEVQNGPYLGEDDIVRFKDDYGRGVEAPRSSKV